MMKLYSQLTLSKQIKPILIEALCYVKYAPTLLVLRETNQTQSRLNNISLLYIIHLQNSNPFKSF